MGYIIKLDIGIVIKYNIRMPLDISYLSARSNGVSPESDCVNMASMRLGSVCFSVSMRQAMAYASLSGSRGMHPNTAAAFPRCTLRERRCMWNSPLLLSPVTSSILRPISFMRCTVASLAAPNVSNANA